MKIRTYTRRSIAALAGLTLVLSASACSFTTTEPDEEPSDAPNQTETTLSVTTLDELLAAYEDAGLITEAETFPLDTTGFANEGVVWDDGSGAYAEFYFIDLDAATDEVKKNYDLASTEGYVDYSGSQMPITAVSGPFLVNFSQVPDPDAFAEVWDSLATTGE